MDRELRAYFDRLERRLNVMEREIAALKANAHRQITGDELVEVLTKAQKLAAAETARQLNEHVSPRDRLYC